MYGLSPSVPCQKSSVWSSPFVWAMHWPYVPANQDRFNATWS